MKHDWYVTEATHVRNPIAPRLLLRCQQCSRLSVGMIVTDEDKEAASRFDEDFDTSIAPFDDLKIVGATDDCYGGRKP